MYKVFSLILLAVSSACGAIVSTGVHFYVNGIDESAALGLPAIAAGNTMFGLTSPVTIPGLTKIGFLSFSASSDPDVSFFFGVQNTTDTVQTYVFPLVIPYVGGPYTTLTDSFADSLTDAVGDGIVTVGLAAGSSAIAQPQVDGANRDGQGTGCTLTGGPGFSGSCNPGPSLTTITIPTTFASGTFGVVVSFTLSPGDIYTLNGQASLGTANVPEPATNQLLGSGLAACICAGLMRSRAIRPRALPSTKPIATS